MEVCILLRSMLDLANYFTQDQDVVRQWGC